MTKSSMGALLRAGALLFAGAMLFAASALDARAVELLAGLGGSSGYGTVALGRNDGASSGVIALGTGFPHGIKLFTGSYNTLYVNNNGNITFNGGYGTYTPIPFPITNLPMLAPYWGDVDTRGYLPDEASNNVYYSDAVAGKFVVTWNDVGYYAGGTNKLNAFQLILTDRSDVARGDFDIEYRYRRLEWTTGGASGGSNGLGGSPAQMGYDAGDGKNFYRHAASGSAAILDLTNTSNVGLPGVWRFEVRGGTPNPPKQAQLVNVRLVETLNAADIALDPASFQTTPASVSTSDGQTRIEWTFAGFPADLTKDLSFDVMFKNPLPGERRMLIAKLELMYNDVNGNPVRSELGSQFIHVYPSLYQIAPATDKPVYGANEAVLISSLVRNLSAAAGVAAVRINVLDAAGQRVAVLGPGAARSGDAGATRTFDGLTFSTGTLYAGNYKLVAELLDSSGQVLASGNGGFAIASAAARAGAVIVTDKQIYQPYELVKLSERISNTLLNASLDDLRVRTVLTNPDGTVRTTLAETLAQLAPSGIKEYAYPVQLGFAAAGRYTASVTVARADGTQLAQASTQFTVGSSADSGAGLTGAITPAPAQANKGQLVSLPFSATNNGNAALAAVLTMRVIDPDARQVDAWSDYAAALAVGGQYRGATQWTATSGTSGNFMAVLTATVGGKAQTLAQAALTVLTLDPAQAARGNGRVLVLVSCKDDAEETVQGTACAATRARTVDQALTAAGMPHAVVTGEAAFRQALRSGQYNTYWLSGRQDKLHGALAGEVREAVYGGEASMIDGEHDQRNGMLDALASVRWRGKSGATSDGVLLAAPLFESQHLATVGRSGRMELVGGAKAQAAFDSGFPAIVGNAYGAGHALQFGFDLPTSLRAEAAWQGPLVAGLRHLAPLPPETVAPGARVPVTISVANPGPGAKVLVTSTLPPGAAYLDAQPPAVVDAAKGTVTWEVTLERQQHWSAALDYQVRSAGLAGLRTVVSTVNPATGAATPYGAPLVLSVNVVGASAATGDAIALLNAMTGLSTPDVHLRERLVLQVRAAMVDFGAGTAAGYDSSIAKLIGVVDQLDGLAGANTAPVRTALDRSIRDAQWRWSETKAQ